MKKLIEYYLKNIPHRGKRHAVRLLMTVLPYKSLRSHYGPVLLCNRKDNTNVYGISGEYGSIITDHFDSVLKRDDVMIDIGTNCGLFSIYAADRLPDGRVYSFEPNPHIYKYFLGNIGLNGKTNIVPFNCAVGPEDGLVQLSFDEHHSGKSAVQTGPAHAGVTVPLFNIAAWNFLADALKDRTIHIKIDVEGYENEILKVLSRAPWFRNISSLIVEIDERNLKSFNSSGSDIYSLMSASGFKAKLGHDTTRHYDEIFYR